MSLLHTLNLKQYCLLLIIIVFLQSLNACCSNTESKQTKIESYCFNNNSVENLRPDNEDDIVFNEIIANQLATLFLHSIYGKMKIERQRPFNIELKNNEIWVVRGSKPIHTFGGLFYIEINKKDAKVLGYFHTR
jgi:ABC-type oligopeptide transport system substrate-binding subunit